MKHTDVRHVSLLLFIVLGFVPAVAQALTLQPPRMVLNRSLFLEWDQAVPTGFVSYEVHASTQAGFTPSAGNRLVTLSSVDLHYVRLQGLLPATVYYFRVRSLATGSTNVSGEVTATTLADGVNEVRIPSIMYHHCQPREQFPAGFDPGGWISTANFSRDMAYLKTHGVNAVGIVEIYNRIVNGVPLPPNPVLITFDDGYVTYLQHAVPILRSNDFQSVNAIVTRKTGGTSDWAVPEWPLMSLMTWAQIKDCQRQGMWMGSHTQTHVDLDLEPYKAYEITGSRDDLVGQLKVHPRYFCYPWGMGGREHRPIIDQVGAAGYTLATRTWPPSMATINSDRLWFPRVFANQNDTLRDFLVKLGVDTDKDGIKDFVEMDWGLDPGKADTDGDGLSDGFEVGYDGNVNTYNPYHPITNPSGRDLSATRADTDLDGVSDGDEILVYGTDPLRADTDGDGLTDGEEVQRGTDPLKPDTDGDGMSDYDEIHVYHTNPLVHDGRRPFTGAAVAVPGCLEVEDFDFGGAGLAYSDTTVTNEGGAYRPFERVDLAAESSASNGVSLGWTRAGEWLTYSVSVATSGQFQVAVRLAAQGAGGVFHLEVDGVDVTGPITVPDTGGWAKWQIVQSRPFAVEAGTRVIKLSMDQVGTSGHVGAFDRMCVVAVPPPGPFGGVPWPLPGRVEIENFNTGGEGVAYHDATAANEGGQYRLAEGVDITRDTTAGNNHVVGWTPAGEWLEYTVNVASSDTYVLETRVAGVGSGGKFKILVDGVDKTGLLSVPHTGAWNAYQVVRKTGVQLTAGLRTVRVVMETQGPSGNVGAFDWFQAVVDTPVVQSAYPAGTPWALPGTVEIENFDTGGEGVAYHDATVANEGGQYRTDDGVDITRDTAAGNNHVVGWTPAGEWLEYTINVNPGGTYTLETRVAGVGSGGQFRIRVNGADKTGLLAVPHTGAWNAYQVVRKPGVELATGVQTVRVEMVTAGPSGHVGAFDWFRVVAETPVVQSAYPLGTPWPLPGTVEIENFDTGGEGVAYHDATVANEGGQYRTDERVDITRDTAAGNNHVVGWTPAGEWLEYTINVNPGGTYTLETRVAGVGSGGQFRIRVNGADKTGLLAVPHTGAWNAYQVVRKPGVELATGVQTVRVEMVTAGPSGHVGAFDWFRVVAETPVVQSAYPLGTPWPLPGTVEIENFDTGGEGVAYHDATAANEGGQYRTDERVDITRDTAAGNNHVVGWTPAGEWLEYTVEVGSSGIYTLETRVAGVGAGGQFRIRVDGSDVSGLLAVPNTGAWNVYQGVQKTGVRLTNGLHIVRVEMVTAGPSGHVGAFDWFKATRVGPLGLSRRANNSESPRPVDVRTSHEDGQPAAGWLAVDGDTNTVWQGEPGAGGWWLTLGYDPEIALTGLTLDWAPGSPTNVQCLYSLDAQTWDELVLPLTNGPLDLHYLWLLFPDGGAQQTPALREIHVE